jgi:hypothetical protein
VPEFGEFYKILQGAKVHYAIIGCVYVFVLVDMN